MVGLKYRTFSKGRKDLEDKLNKTEDVGRRTVGFRKINTTNPKLVEARKRLQAREIKVRSKVGGNVNVKRNVKGNVKVQAEELSCTQIVLSDFGQNTDTTYTIVAPGKYCLANDVPFASTVEFTPVIQIAPGVNNVELDLCGHTISQSSSTGAILIYGIWIGGVYEDSFTLGNDNITIRNGSIVDFSGGGVFAISPSSDVLYHDLHFYDLNILRNGNTGFDSDPIGAPGLTLVGAAPPADAGVTRPLEAEDAVFFNIVIERVRVNNSIGGLTGSAGVVVQLYDNLVIRDTQANNTTVPFQDGNTNGGCFAYILYGVNMQMTNCQGNDTRLEDYNTQQTGGLDHEYSQNSYFYNCQFNNNYGLASFIVNSNISAGINMTFENVQFNNSRAGTYASSVYGAHGSGATDLLYDGRGYKFINCSFNSTSADSDSFPIFMGGIITQISVEL